jgi:hypothetical protein
MTIWLDRTDEAWTARRQRCADVVVEPGLRSHHVPWGPSQYIGMDYANKYLAAPETIRNENSLSISMPHCQQGRVVPRRGLEGFRHGLARVSVQTTVASRTQLDSSSLKCRAADDDILGAGLIKGDTPQQVEVMANELHAGWRRGAGRTCTLSTANGTRRACWHEAHSRYPGSPCTCAHIFRGSGGALGRKVSRQRREGSVSRLSAMIGQRLSFALAGRAAETGQDWLPPPNSQEEGVDVTVSSHFHARNKGCGE